jgi:hypothetical protein
VADSVALGGKATWRAAAVRIAMHQNEITTGPGYR